MHVSDKVTGKGKIYLTEGNELVKTDLGNAEILNKFSPNIVQDLESQHIQTTNLR